MRKLWKKIPKRYKRVAALMLGAGIAFMGAGNIYGMDALQSAMFGATGSVLGLLMALSFTYAGKGEVPEDDFNAAVNSQIESINSKTKPKTDK